MALLAVVRSLERRLRLGLTLSAVHVDYGARGRESDRDRTLVERACAEAGVPLHVLRLERPLTGADFQERAREVRYRFARETAQLVAATVVVTAHNRDDQAETVLYRLAKYASPRALAGMRPRRGDLARPLLCLGGAEVRKYCAAAGIEYGEDASNATAAYARNVLRLDVVPRLEAFNPRLSETLATSALLAAAEADVLAAAVAEARRRTSAPADEAVAALDVAALSGESPALRALVLHDVAAGVLGGHALVGHRLVEALVALATRPGGGRISLGRGLEAAREGRLLVVRRVAAGHACSPVTITGDELMRPAEAPVLFCGRRVWLALRPGATFRRERAAGGEGFVGLRTAPVRLVLRHPHPGERFAPDGLGGATTVARFLAAARVPPKERRRAVLLAADGAVAWLGFCAPGGRPAARVAQPFRVDESTVCTLHVKLEEA